MNTLQPFYSRPRNWEQALSMWFNKQLTNYELILYADQLAPQHSNEARQHIKLSQQYTTRNE